MRKIFCNLRGYCFRKVAENQIIRKNDSVTSRVRYIEHAQRVQTQNSLCICAN